MLQAVTIDIGPFVRSRAERYASDQLSRPVRIGGMTINVLKGAGVLKFAIQIEKQQ